MEDLRAAKSTDFLYERLCVYGHMARSYLFCGLRHLLHLLEIMFDF